MKRVFGVLTFLLLPAVVCAAEPVAVPSAPFLDYFAGRGYVFEKFEGMTREEYEELQKDLNKSETMFDDEE